jgi:hypothetical protein
MHEPFASIRISEKLRSWISLQSAAIVNGAQHGTNYTG